MINSLIEIPQSEATPAEIFDDFFSRLHEALQQQEIAFEIAATSQNVSFGFATKSPAVSELTKGLLYAHAPSANIKTAKDFLELDKLSSQTQSLALDYRLKHNQLLPLKDYSEFQGDSLASLLSALSRCLPEVSIVYQILLKPAEESALYYLRVELWKKLIALTLKCIPKYWFKRGLAATILGRLSEKSRKRLYYANLRIIIQAVKHNTDTDLDLNPIAAALDGALSNFNTLDLNQFTKKKYRHIPGAFLARKLVSPYLLSTQELAGLFHLPSEKDFPNVVHVLSTRQAPPKELPSDKRDPEISFFGATNYRDQKTIFGIKRNDRRRHLYISGKSGSGKSKLLELLIRNDIMHGQGVAVIDPHGDLVDNILSYIPERRIQDVIIFNPADLEYPASFNPLEQVPEELKMRVTLGFIEIFKKLFGSNWTPRLEHVLRYTTLALLDTPGTSVLSILQMLTDKQFRQIIVSNCKDQVVKSFWTTEFAGWSEKFDSEAITPLINKVGQFVATNMIRNIVGQPVNRFNFREIMDRKKILLMKISKGILGEENASLLGAIAVTKFYQAALSRADTPENQRSDYYLYVDEFQNFATETFGEILSEARKYRLNLTIANQFLGQLDEKMRSTVFGNVGSLVTFRVGAEDAEHLSLEFKPRFSPRDIINLGVRDFITKISIDGEVREAFSGKTLTIKPPAENFCAACINFSRANYARPLKEVEQILAPGFKSGKKLLSREELKKNNLEGADFKEPLI